MSGKTLYHYTSQKGLLGIVGGGCLRLWATNVAYLNDSLEFYHAFEIAHKSIKMWCEKLSVSKDIHSKNVLDFLCS